MCPLGSLPFYDRQDAAETQRLEKTRKFEPFDDEADFRQPTEQSMADPARLLEIIETHGATTVRFLESKVLNDHKSDTIATELLRIAAALGQRELRLDFGNVEYLQSSVLGRLVNLQRERAAAGARLILCNVNPVVYKVFTVTKLDKFFIIESAKSQDEPGS
jgi:anti-sigma B factor antagonist